MLQRNEKMVKGVAASILGTLLFVWILRPNLPVNEVTEGTAAVGELHAMRKELGQAEDTFPADTILKCDTVDTNWVRRLTVESERVWNISKAKRMRSLTQIGAYFKNWKSMHDLRTLWDFFPPSYHCPRPMERVGRVGDGGYWICGFTHIAETKKSCVVYSYGIGGEITMEREILETSNCIVRMYDFTIDQTKGNAPDLVKGYPGRAHLYQLGLASKNSGELRTLRSVMESHGDTFIDVLKIDVEGFEFDALLQILEDFPTRLPFGQLLVEFHLLAYPSLTPTPFAKFKKFLHFFEALENAGLRPFSAEINLQALINLQTFHAAWSVYTFLNSRIDDDYFLN